MSNFSQTEFGYVPSLALFERPSVNTGILNYKWVEYQPVSQVANSGLLQFIISGTSNYYVNLESTYLQIKGEVLKKGISLDESDQVSLENLPLHSLWSQVDISLQQKNLSSKIGTNYAYKAYLDTLLNSSRHEIDNQLSSQLFFKDVAGKMEDKIANPSWRIRKSFIDRGREVQIEGPLYLDLCQQARFLLNGVEIGLKLWPNKAAFALSSEDIEKGYYFKIVEASLKVCMVEVSPAILVGHAAALKEAPALYPYNQSDFRAYSIPKGQYEYTVDDIFQGDIPSDLIVGLVSSQGYIGSYDKNPFNFYHYDCSYCGFFVNGNSTPSQPFKPLFGQVRSSASATVRPPKTPKPPKSGAGGGGGNDKSGGGGGGADEPRGGDRKRNRDLSDQGQVVKKQESAGYSDAYLSLFGKDYYTTNDVSINVVEYPFGYCLYKFQISENSAETNGDFVSVPRRGHTRLTLQFRKPLPESVTLMLYAHFPRVMQIDEARNVVQ